LSVLRRSHPRRRFLDPGPSARAARADEPLGHGWKYVPSLVEAQERPSGAKIVPRRPVETHR